MPNRDEIDQTIPMLVSPDIYNTNRVAIVKMGRGDGRGGPPRNTAVANRLIRDGVTGHPNFRILGFFIDPFTLNRYVYITGVTINPTPRGDAITILNP